MSILSIYHETYEFLGEKKAHSKSDLCRSDESLGQNNKKPVNIDSKDCTTESKITLATKPSSSTSSSKAVTARCNSIEHFIPSVNIIYSKSVIPSSPSHSFGEKSEEHKSSFTSKINTVRNEEPGTCHCK